MSNKYTERAEAVRNLAKQYKSVIEMGEFLNDIGNLENTAAAIQARIDALAASEAQARESKEREHAALEAISLQTATARIALEQLDAAIVDRQGNLDRVQAELKAFRESLQ